ncbi:hypothetical protein GQ43DRAFT_464320 [Delitschia confertaspora ATCC 74209]|uniref:Uncharacterized protein n=1 Tax=Delitschia confertaspora ATCC 74209 TaxID=1513339 RepID=A0A9P4JMW3_9PLEO|nr:hypothetical protein GQ43DRAFT_464320 [Delitschia confertaspora ATCC 74209]
MDQNTDTSQNGPTRAMSIDELLEHLRHHPIVRKHEAEVATAESFNMEPAHSENGVTFNGAAGFAFLQPSGASHAGSEPLNNATTSSTPQDPLAEIQRIVLELQHGQTAVTQDLKKQGEALDRLAQRQADLAAEVKNIKHGAMVFEENVKKETEAKAKQFDLTIRALQGSFKLIRDAQGQQKETTSKLKEEIERLAKNVGQVEPGEITPGEQKASLMDDILQLALRQLRDDVNKTSTRGQEALKLLHRIFIADADNAREHEIKLTEMMFTQDNLVENVKALWKILEHAEDIPNSPIAGVNKFKVPIKIQSCIASASMGTTDDVLRTLKQQVEEYKEAGSHQADARFQFIPAKDSLAFISETAKLVEQFCKSIRERKRLVRQLAPEEDEADNLNKQLVIRKRGPSPHIGHSWNHKRRAVSNHEARKVPLEDRMDFTLTGKPASGTGTPGEEGRLTRPSSPKRGRDNYGPGAGTGETYGPGAQPAEVYGPGAYKRPTDRYKPTHRGKGIPLGPKRGCFNPHRDS